MAEHITDIGQEARQKHRVLVAIAHIDGAHHHQETGQALCRPIPPLILFRGLGHDAELHLNRVTGLDEDAVLVDDLVFQLIEFTVFGPGGDNQAFRVLVVCDGDGGVGSQGDFALISVLVLRQLCLVGIFLLRLTGLSRGTDQLAILRDGTAETVVGLP